MEKRKLKMFVFNVCNIIDLITNSSSELFVLQGDTKENVIALLEATYPNYINEYREVKRIDELSTDELDTYISFEYNSWSNNKQQIETNLIPGFTFDEMYYVPEWAKANGFRSEDRYCLRDITEEMRERIVDAISPKKDMYFLFSLDENPNWERQQDLMGIASRYHLG